jgi:hypothetical protein
MSCNCFIFRQVLIASYVYLDSMRYTCYIVRRAISFFLDLIITHRTMAIQLKNSLDMVAEPDSMVVFHGLS